jgi:hypothetical protein
MARSVTQGAAENFGVAADRARRADQARINALLLVTTGAYAFRPAMNRVVSDGRRFAGPSAGGWKREGVGSSFIA